MARSSRRKERALIRLEPKSKLSSADWRELDTMMEHLAEQEREWLDDIGDKQTRDEARGVFTIGMICVESTVKEIKAKFKDEDLLFIARDPKTKIPVGFCAVQRKPRLGWSSCNGLYVKPEWRRQGIASDFLWMALDKTKKSGLDSMDLRVSVKNKEAIALYRNLGFSKTSYTMEKWIE